MLHRKVLSNDVAHGVRGDAVLLSDLLECSTSAISIHNVLNRSLGEDGRSSDTRVHVRLLQNRRRAACGRQAARRAQESRARLRP